jgi:Zn-dependent protease with chaperone function
MNWTPSSSKLFAGSPRATDRGSASLRRARGLFALNCALGVSTLLGAAATLGRGLGSIQLIPASRAAHFTLFAQGFSRPSVNSAAAPLLALVLLAGVVLAVAVNAALDGAVGNRRFRRTMAARCVRREGDFMVFDDEDVQAFCGGLLRPQIYISTGALAMLSGMELEAVLAHERHHRRRRDPFRIAIGRVIARALFFLPGAGLLHKRYCAMAELAADDFAIRSQAGGSRALASALLAFTTQRKPAEAVGIAPERVEQMMGRQPDWPLPLALAGAGLAGSVLTIAAASLLAGPASARASLALPFLSAQPCVAVLALIAATLTWLGVRRVRAPLSRAL